MNTTLKEENNYYVMYFDGRLDTAAAPEADKAPLPLLESEGHDIILDCSKLEYISSSGLRIFLNVLKNVKGKGHQVFIRGINESIQKVFKMTGFYNLFKVME